MTHDTTEQDKESQEQGQPRPRRSPRSFDQDPFLDEDMPEFHWSVPWSDLMMTMFVLFTVLFVYASSKVDYMKAFRGHVEYENVDQLSELGSKKGENQVFQKNVPGVLPDVGPQEIREMVSAAVQEAGLQDVVVEMEGDTIRISMHGPMLFDRFQADIKPGGVQFLNTVARIVAKARYDVIVHGHTDSTPVHTPQFDTNWELSAQRAVNVAKQLIAANDVNPAQITVAGHSMYKPRAPNLSSEGKSRNRRVEIELKRPEAPEPAEPQGAIQ
ncbi:OmpA/MotB family protein [Desulfocurvus sp. DL9XJH121]